MSLICNCIAFVSTKYIELTILTECAHSAQCAPLKHHYDECVERVTAHHNDPHKGKAKGEDCIEECKCTHFESRFTSLGTIVNASFQACVLHI